jgi:hypothetical protein
LINEGKINLKDPNTKTRQQLANAFLLGSRPEKLERVIKRNLVLNHPVVARRVTQPEDEEEVVHDLFVCQKHLREKKKLYKELCRDIDSPSDSSSDSGSEGSL